MNIIVSKHAKKRLKQRVHKGWKKVARDAFEKGVDHRELRGRLKKYVDWLALKHGGSKISAYKIYYDYVYLFAGPVLVTVMHVPRVHAALCRQLTLKKIDKPGSP